MFPVWVYICYIFVLIINLVSMALIFLKGAKDPGDDEVSNTDALIFILSYTGLIILSIIIAIDCIRK